MSFTAILFLHATAFQLGILSAARLAPGFLTGLFAGVWVDRLPRRPILIAVDLGRAALLGTIPLAAIFHALRIEQLYLVTFLVSILTTLFDIAYRSYLPALIDVEQLLEGNSKLSASASVAETGGFAIAGWLVEVFTAPLALLVDAVSFAISAVSLSSIREREAPRVPQAQPDMRREIAEGLRAVFDDPMLRATTLCASARAFFTGIYGTLVVLYMARNLGFAPGVLGCIWAVGGVSAFFGAFAAGPLVRRFGTGVAMIAGLFGWSLSMFLIPLAQGTTLIAAALLVLQQLSGDGASTIYEINLVSLRQSIAPERLLGRVNAGAGFANVGGMLAGSLAGGLLGDGIGVRRALFMAAAGTLLCAVWLLFSPVRCYNRASACASSSSS